MSLPRSDALSDAFFQEPEPAPLRRGKDGTLSAEAASGKPSALVQSRLALWHGARERGETGVEAAEGWAAFALFEVPAVPDFSSPRFPDLAGLDEAQRVQRVGQLQNQILAALYPLGDRTAVSLRYRIEKRPGHDARIRLFLIGRSFAPTAEGAETGLHSFRQSLIQAFPAEYPLHDWQTGAGRPGGEALVQEVLFPQGIASIAEILKPEQAIPAWHEPALCGFSFYYLPLAFSPAENDMTGFCRTLVSDQADQFNQAGQAAPADPLSADLSFVDVTLQPALPLTSTERAEVAGWGTLAEKWGRDQKMEVAGGLYSRPQTVEVAADPQAQEARKGYADLLSRYGGPQSRLFLAGIRVLSRQSGATRSVAAALAARALSPGGNHQLVTLDRGHPAFDRALRAVQHCFVTPAVCNEPLWQHPDAPETLRRLHRLVDLKEVSGFFRLPIAGRDGCPGVALDTGMPSNTDISSSAGIPSNIGMPGGGVTPLQKPAAPAIRLGRFADGARVLNEQASFAPNDLSKHALIVGTPGSGKTTLCFSLLHQLWKEQRIPFLVLEPAKTEYRSLRDLPELGRDLVIFTPGNERIAPFRFNPLEVPDKVALAEHIASLGVCFSAAFSLADPLPMLLDEALQEAYRERGWSEYGAGGDDPALTSPTLADLLRWSRAVASRSSYQGELAGNIRAALETRLGSLMRGPKGRCFNTARSVPWDEVMARPAVFELEALSEDEKALFMLLLLTRVRAHARSTRRSGAPLSHVLLVEEAHTVIGRETGGRADRANPKEAAVRFFVRMLAEMRALGEGLVVADQLPTAVAPEVIKLTNLKVMHRVVAMEDRQELGQAMTLDGAQIEQAATLPPGHSLVFQEGWSRSRTVQEPDFKGAWGVDVPPDDGAVRQGMQPFLESKPIRAAYLPYADCGEVCCRCDARVRERSERWASAKLAPIRLQISRRPDASAEMVAFEEYVQGLDLTGGKQGPTYPAAPDNLKDAGDGRNAESQDVRCHCAHVHFHEAVLSNLNLH